MKNKWLLALIVVALGLVFSTVFPAGNAFAVNCDQNPSHWKCDSNDAENPDKDDGNGKAGDSQGHNKVTICHKPGTPAEKTKQVPKPAVDGHLGHGDYLGECKEEETPDDGPTGSPPIRKSVTKVEEAEITQLVCEGCVTVKLTIDKEPNMELVINRLETLKDAGHACPGCVEIEVILDEDGDVEWALPTLEKLTESGYVCPSCVEAIITFDGDDEIMWVLDSLTQLEDAGYKCGVSE